MAFCSEEVFPWLKNLPLAPEYHPTLQEFQDPIAYIFKIEKEASQYGICKIVPPLPPAPKKTVVTNFNRSLAARLTENDPDSTPTFTTRQQQIGFCPRKPCPVKKPVWQSGERYTFHEFESKAKSFEKIYLKKCGKRVGSQHYSALEIETLYWRATVDKPFSVEYANDMPGSAFAPLRPNRKGGVALVKEAGDVGESSWNMRGVSRAKGSLLKYMKEEIPGVTSPMVYLAMLFSWFAWHVEDHDLHSLNYLHTGAGKTWYGVPRDAAVAFEEVVRVHGYGGEVNPLVTFAVLGEKTTVISPEVLVSAGVPCCRLVQNAGEFVVTFPRAYHSGFSHGFNCGEASNIATPEWLRFAKDAAFRRAAINYPPMVSHFQLLFDYALQESSSSPATDSAGPRSSRLKEKKKGEGESMIKEQFVQNVIQDNNLLHKLGRGSSVVLLPESSLDVTVCANLRVGSHVRLDCPSQDIKSPTTPLSGGFISDQVSSMRAKIASLYERKGISSLDGNNIFHSPASHILNQDHGGDYNRQGDRLSDQRLFSCVKCGILTFACTAIIQPREAAARYLMSADCNLFNDWTVNTGVPIDEYNASAGSKERDEVNVRHSFSLGSAHRLQGASQKNEIASISENEEGTCALVLLALNYGNSSDSEENQVEPDAPLCDEETALATSSPQSHIHSDNYEEPSVVQDCHIVLKAEPLGACRQKCGPRETNDNSHQAKSSADLDDASSTKSCTVENKCKIHSNISSRSSLVAPASEEPMPGKSLFPVKNKNEPYLPSCNEDSSRMHIFCLEHAIDVEEQLRPIGGAHIYLLCHPDYPRAEAEARLLAKELQIDNFWNDIEFKDATEDDEDRIKSALDSEDVIPGIGDWAVKLGINLFYSANLSWSPLYTKQMPYNSVIYSAFGRNSSSSPAKLHDTGRSVKQKKVVAGKWCGKIWMSNQVHPFLAPRDGDEQDEERSNQPSVVPNEVSHPQPRSRIETTVTKRKSSGKRKLSRKTAPSKKCRVYNNEEVSDGSLTDGSHRPHKVAVRRRRSKISKKEGTFSDDQGDENLYVQHQSDTGSKQSESPDREYSDSDPSVDGASHRSHCRISRRRPAEFTLTEDEVSDDSMDDDSQPRRITLNLRGKLAKQTEEEDALSSGDSGDTSHWQHKRTVKRKQNSSELEDDIPNSPSEGNTPTQPRIRRNSRLALRSKPQSGRRKVSQLAKPGSSRVTKQVTSSQVKQGTARLKGEKREPKPRQLDILVKEESGGLSSRLRKRNTNVSKEGKAELKGKKQAAKKSLRTSVVKTPASRNDAKVRDEEAEFQCDLDGCTMGFSSKQELVLHKKNICPVKGCGKKFFSHKYLVQHRRVHVDDRPLKCPWKGCKMAFKWAWARTEHIRVHTGARPYVCAEPGCGQTFRFVSDFSRHKRKTGHSIRGKG